MTYYCVDVFLRWLAVAIHFPWLDWLCVLTPLDVFWVGGKWTYINLIIYIYMCKCNCAPCTAAWVTIKDKFLWICVAVAIPYRWHVIFGLAWRSMHTSPSASSWHNCWASQPWSVDPKVDDHWGAALRVPLPTFRKLETETSYPGRFFCMNHGYGSPRCNGVPFHGCPSFQWTQTAGKLVTWNSHHRQCCWAKVVMFWTLSFWALGTRPNFLAKCCILVPSAMMYSYFVFLVFWTWCFSNLAISIRSWES